MLLSNVTARQAADASGIKVEYCQVILAAARRRAPQRATVSFSTGVSMDIEFTPSRAGDPFAMATLEVMCDPFVSVHVGGTELIIKESVSRKHRLTKGRSLPPSARLVGLAQLAAAIDEALQASPKPRRKRLSFRRR